MRSLLYERLLAPTGLTIAASRSGSLRNFVHRQMRRSTLDLYDEPASLANLALDVHGSRMQLHQLAHQRQSDPRPLLRPRSSAFDAVEAFKQLRNLLSRNAHPGVFHAQPHPAALYRFQARGDHTLKGVFERIGHQVE